MISAPVARGEAAEYAVDGFRIGGNPVLTGPNYRLYQCRTQPSFAGATQCERSRKFGQASGDVEATFSLLHDASGATLYAAADVEPIGLTRAAVEDEIRRLSAVIGEAPANTQWQNVGDDGGNAVIVTWGQVRLDALGQDDAEALADGKSPRVGMLVDYAGRPQASAKDGQPVFRLIGGAGYVYAAGFGSDGRGHRHDAAIDPVQVLTRQYEATLSDILVEDRALAGDDYRLWPRVASATRNLALDTAIDVADAAIDQVFEREGSKKLHSHVWAVLPSGAIGRLSRGIYSRLDVYGPATKYPDIRHDIEAVVQGNPSDAFIAFADFVHGDFGEALAADRHALITDVLHYAVGYETLQSAVTAALDSIKTRTPSNRNTNSDALLKNLVDTPPNTPDNTSSVDAALVFINKNPDYFDRKALSLVVPGIDRDLLAAQEAFGAVLRHPESPLADDAAYMLGWIALQSADPDRAFGLFGRAMVVGNRDWDRAALIQTIRMLQDLPVDDGVRKVESLEDLSSQPALWYVLARSAFRTFDYRKTIAIAELGLEKLGIPVDGIPVTTDRDKIVAALEKMDAKRSNDLDLRELIYVAEASREISNFETLLQHPQSRAADAFEKAVESVVVEYSLLRDPPVDPATGQPAPGAGTSHKDFRQAIHLIERSLDEVPRTPDHVRLRQWLHFRRVRVLTAFAPERIPAAISAMADEFPTSELLNNAMAEQVYADGIVMKDPDAAERVFHDLLRRYPYGNAVDNAYSWMAIIEACAGRAQAARELNEQIVRRFPFTRHAAFARSRLADPDRSIDSKSCGG